MSDVEGPASLIGGRRTQPLTDAEIKTVLNTFLGLDNTVASQHRPGAPTAFVPEVQEDGEIIGKIYFSSDIYPGPNVADPNSALSMQAAAAHEISHCHRWRDTTQLPYDKYRDLDEALTSLDALLRFSKMLSNYELEQLARDAVIRLQQLATVLDADRMNAAAPEAAEFDENKRDSPVAGTQGALVEKSSVKKASAEKASVKKASAEKASVKKASVKKAPVKKAPVKKAPAKKAPVKKAPAKKAPAKRLAIKKTPAELAAQNLSARRRLRSSE